MLHRSAVVAQRGTKRWRAIAKSRSLRRRAERQV
jgi:hypothetical protein